MNAPELTRDARLIRRLQRGARALDLALGPEPSIGQSITHLRLVELTPTSRRDRSTVTQRPRSRHVAVGTAVFSALACASSLGAGLGSGRAVAVAVPLVRADVVTPPMSVPSTVASRTSRRAATTTAPPSHERATRTSVPHTTPSAIRHR